MELTDHGAPADGERNDALAGLAAAPGCRRWPPTTCTTPRPAARLATALAAVRARRSLDEIDGWLPAAGTAHLRSGAEMAARFAPSPGAVARAAEFGAECAFALDLVAPELPPFVSRRAHRDDVAARAHPPRRRRALRRRRVPRGRRQLEHELAMIEDRKFPGYFLIVYDIVEFCRATTSSARAAARRPTRRSATRWGSPTWTRWRTACCSSGSWPRSGTAPPTSTWTSSPAAGRRSSSTSTALRAGPAAQVANVISYRPRSAVRDVAKALGFSPGQQDAWSKQIERWGARRARGRRRASPRRWWSSPTSCSASPGTWASTPAAW